MNAGDVATELIALIDSEWARLDATGQRIVANRIVERFIAWIPPRESPRSFEPMTDDEALRFEQDTMHFGMYAGERFADIDTDYLAWLADSSRDLWRKLHAYLRSDLVRNRQESEDRDG